MTLRYTEKNHWTLEVHEDLLNLTESQAREVVRLITSNYVLVFKRQSLTADQEVELAKKLGEPRPVYDLSKPLEESPHRYVAVNEYITRITGKLNKDGKCTGAAGQPETFDWHLDLAFSKIRAPLYCLYGVEHTEGSCTSFLSFADAYKDLDVNLLERIKDKKVMVGHSQPLPTPYNTHVKPEKVSAPTVTEYDLIRTTPEGVTWLHFPPYQTKSMVDTSDEEFEELYSVLKEHVLQEKFMYHHYWEDGDFVVADQRTSMHKRWAFDKMQERVVHRMTIWPMDVTSPE